MMLTMDNETMLCVSILFIGLIFSKLVINYTITEPVRLMNCTTVLISNETGTLFLHFFICPNHSLYICWANEVDERWDRYFVSAGCFLLCPISSKLINLYSSFTKHLSHIFVTDMLNTYSLNWQRTNDTMIKARSIVKAFFIVLYSLCQSV